MLIGELVQKTGFSKDTIRYYEKTGLLNPREIVRRENNYKDYSEVILRHLLLIKWTKPLGFTLREAKEFLLLDEEGRVNCDTIGDSLQKKAWQISEKIRELQAIQRKLNELEADCTGDCLQTLKKGFA